MIFFQLCFSVITKLKMRRKSTNSVDKSHRHLLLCWHLLIASQRFDQFRYQHYWSRKRRTTFFNGVVSTQRRAARRKRISCRTVCADDALGIVLFPFVVIFIYFCSSTSLRGCECECVEAGPVFVTRVLVWSCAKLLQFQSTQRVPVFSWNWWRGAAAGPTTAEDSLKLK